MSNINKQTRDKLKSAAAKAVDNFDPNMFVETRDVLALLDELEAKDRRNAELNSTLERWAVDRAQSASELEAAEKKTVEMPTFGGYVPHVARELQAAFRIACDNAGINVAAAGKGE